MKTELDKHYPYFLQLAADSISQAVQQVITDKNLSNFILWLLRKDNSHQEDYLRMMGVAGSIELELKLFSQVLPLAELVEIAPYIALLNAYFGYETLSDNLGVGLAASAKNFNPNYLSQRQVLLHFNQQMINKINGDKENCYEAFLSNYDHIQKISVNKKTLAPQQMQLFIKAYAEYNKNAPLYALEHSFLAILILNIETCLQLLESLKNNPIYALLKESLIARYASVSKIIERSEHASWQELAEWGMHSILVIPTLAYCIGALNEIKLNPNFKAVIDNDLLYSAMSDAAMLTRLLNDIGTHLLRMNAMERNNFYHKIQNHLAVQQFDTIFSYLSFLAKQPEFLLPLTRIRKDLQHGEFNICLDPLAKQTSLETALQLFCQGMDYYVELFQQKYKQLLVKLEQLNDSLGNDQASKIILHFVQFHEYKYSFEFETPEGDYAITNNK